VDAVNLEHILPRRPTDADWPDFAPEEIPQWTNRLGNQTLLKKSQNKLIGNKPWATKQPILQRSELTLTKTAAYATTWDKGAIEARQRELARMAVKAWPR
jgi:hypothetical protein